MPFLFLLILLLTGCSPSAASENRVCFKNTCFTVELAVSAEEMMRGLQFRTSLDRDAGMLFIFSREGRYSFWMKDTLIPLDMIWLDINREVVYIARNVPPCRKDPCPTYRPDKTGLYVLEINAGLADRMGIHVGDRAAIRLKAPQRYYEHRE